MNIDVINVIIKRIHQCVSPVDRNQPKYTGVNFIYKFDKLDTRSRAMCIVVDQDEKPEIQMNSLDRDVFLEIMGKFYDQASLIELDN